MSGEIDVKPGYKTTEWWGAVAVIAMGVLVTSGAIPTDGPWVRAIALISSALTSMGYTAARAQIKSGP